MSQSHTAVSNLDYVLELQCFCMVHCSHND